MVKIQITIPNKRLEDIKELARQEGVKLRVIKSPSKKRTKVRKKITRKMHC